MGVDASRLLIVDYPDPVLRRKAEAVAEITPMVRDVAARMIELMREAEGIGLAAPQVGLSWRLFVCHVPPDQGRSADASPPSATHSPMVCINPVLTAPAGGLEPYEEGCLSLPGIQGEVLRPPLITLTATDFEGRRFTLPGTGLLARCWQHEMDHLDGVLIIDRMTQSSRIKNRRKIKALEEE